MNRYAQRVPYEDAERQLARIFRRIIFDPILAEIKKREPGVRTKIENAVGTPLRVALQKGTIQFSDGVFSGDFSAGISSDLRKLGAKFDKRAGVYRLNTFALPAWVRDEALMFKARAKDVHEAVKERLGAIQKGLDASVDSNLLDADKTVASVNGGFQDVARSIETMPKLTPEARERLAKAYTENMKLWIKKFSEEQIEQLRGIVEKNANQGYRFDALMDGIRNRYGVTASKAKFLARQETALFVSKFRKERFGEAGVRRYRWSSAHDARVRDRHKHLDGKVFYYDSPPIVDEATGRRGNPGEDFNCRCVDVPLLENVSER
jgi:SPP1 gp7 family putative phage head morphogenesis protein